MTEIIGDTIIYAPEPEQQCDMCGKIAELRPYGRNGECICFDCGMKNEEDAKVQFSKIFNL